MALSGDGGTTSAIHSEGTALRLAVKLTHDPPLAELRDGGGWIDNDLRRRRGEPAEEAEHENIAVNGVIYPCPRRSSAGTTAHRIIAASLLPTSQTNASTLTAIRLAVTAGNRTGVLEASRRGTMGASPSTPASSLLPGAPPAYPPRLHSAPDFESRGL